MLQQLKQCKWFIDIHCPFGMIKKDGLDIRAILVEICLVKSIWLDSNGDFQPSPMNKYIVDTRWDLDENGDLQSEKENYGLTTIFLRLVDIYLYTINVTRMRRYGN